MHVEAWYEDERWDDHYAEFRVFIYSRMAPGDDSVFGVGAYKLSDCEVDEALSWAEAQAGADDLFSLALSYDHPDQGLGLVWLLGTDANTSMPGERAARALELMRDRRQKRFSAGGGPDS